METIHVSNAFLVAECSMVPLMLDELALIETVENGADSGFLDTGPLSDFRGGERLIPDLAEESSNLLSVRDFGQLIGAGLSERIDINRHGRE